MKSNLFKLEYNNFLVIFTRDGSGRTISQSKTSQVASVCALNVTLNLGGKVPGRSFLGSFCSTSYFLHGKKNKWKSIDSNCSIVINYWLFVSRKGKNMTTRIHNVRGIVYEMELCVCVCVSAPKRESVCFPFYWLFVLINSKRVN